jgi:hypothetical protein
MAGAGPQSVRSWAGQPALPLLRRASRIQGATATISKPVTSNWRRSLAGGCTRVLRDGGFTPRRDCSGASGSSSARRMRDRMLELRERCEDGERRACVRLGIIIGENRERRAAWRREHPEVFFYESER